MKEVNAFYLSERTARAALRRVVKDGMVLKIISVSMLVQVTKMAGNFPAADEPNQIEISNFLLLEYRKYTKQFTRSSLHHIVEYNYLL